MAGKEPEAFAALSHALCDVTATVLVCFPSFGDMILAIPGWHCI